MMYSGQCDQCGGLVEHEFDSPVIFDPMHVPYSKIGWNLCNTCENERRFAEDSPKIRGDLCPYRCVRPEFWEKLGLDPI